jgi:serpin B
MGDAVRRALGSSGFVAAVAAFCACTSTVAPNAGPKPDVCDASQGSSAGAQSLATADTAFAVAFFAPAVAAADGQDANVIVSPYSVSAAMAMADVGAAGETQSQIESVLRLPASAATEAPAYAALECAEESEGTSNGNTLLIANSVWAQSGASFEPTFKSTLATGYDAPLQQVDFAGDPAGAAAQVNSWVSGKTQGMIPSLLGADDVDDKTRFVLTDAIYFKGVWANGFDPASTKPAPFTREDASQAQVPTMTGTVNAPSSRQADLTVVELPYKGGALAMDFLMPTTPGAGVLAAFESALTPASLTATLSGLGAADQLVLYVPRFSFTSRVELGPVLTGMGMTDAFDEKLANFSGIDGAMDLSIHTVVQQAFVEVDEQGTVAAAATAVSLCMYCEAVSEPNTIHLDQPFVFLIRDTRNGAILFMGHVTNPAG